MMSDVKAETIAEEKEKKPVLKMSIPDQKLFAAIQEKMKELKAYHEHVDELMERAGISKKATSEFIAVDCQGGVIKAREEIWAKSEFMKVFIEAHRRDNLPQPWALDQDPMIIRSLLWYMQSGDKRVFLEGNSSFQDRLKRAAAYFALRVDFEVNQRKDLTGLRISGNYRGKGTFYTGQILRK
ncbi:hypothetical protein AAMO2058_000803600 [Amorphochlora amoebiformis]